MFGVNICVGRKINTTMLQLNTYQRDLCKERGAREERTGRKAIIFGTSYYNRTFAKSVPIMNNLVMNNTILKQP